MHVIRNPALPLAALLSLAPAAALADGSGAAEAAQAAAGEAAVTAAAAAQPAADPVSEAEARIPQTLKHEDRAVTVMDQPLDGSSVAAFEEGLARVEQEAAPAEYQRLKAAIEKLLFYDIGAKRNREVFYQRISGQTPNEIIRQASQR